MGTQLFIRTMFFLFLFFLGCHTRRGCQISNQISLSGGYSGINKHFVPTASRCHPLPYHSLVFSAKPRRGCVCGCREWTNTGRVNTMAILHLGTQWENYPISHLCRSERVFIFTRWIVLLRNEVVQKSL